MFNLNKQQKKILILVILALSIVGMFIFLSQTNRLPRKLPITEQAAQLRGDNVDQIKLDMSKPNYVDEVEFKLDEVFSNLSDQQITKLKNLLFETFPYSNKFIITKSVESIKKDSINEYRFSISTSNNELYDLELKAYSNTFYLVIKKDNSIIYKSPAY